MTTTNKIFLQLLERDIGSNNRISGLAGP